MEAHELSTYLMSEAPILLDVREPWEFEICHIANSVNIPMNQIPQQLEQLTPDNEYVIICHHGVRSLRVIQYLRQQSFDHLINLDGGIDAWAHQVDTNMPTY